MEKDTNRASDILSTITIGILFLAVLLLVVFSAVSYRQSTDAQRENNDTRAVRSYVVTAVRDSVGAEVTPKEFSGAPGLSIADPDEEFERRIYAWDGKLMEEYVEKDGKISPKTALVIGSAGTFEAEYIEDGLLRIRTEKGTSYVRVGER